VPTQFLVTRSHGSSAATLADLTSPDYLSFDGEGEGGRAIAGLGPLVAYRVRSDGDGQATMGLSVTALLMLASDGEATALVGPLAPTGREAVPVALVSDGEALFVVAALRLGLPPIAGHGQSRSRATFIPFLPAIREPAWYELRGTVNLVRNASVEHPDMALRDWTGVSGATIALDDTTAWHGLRSVEITYPASGSDAAVSVDSIRGLGLSGGLDTAMVGSVSLSGTITQLLLRLTATYSDATTDSIDGDLFDLATADDDWLRVASPSLPLDPAKTLDYLTLAVVHPVADVETVIHADGAQIEQDRGDGATPFAQGDMGAHYAWLGLASFSMSLRETMAVTT
jgi:hypothetical protein